MPSTSETGHAKNVANFEDLIAFCTGYGATYNPSNIALTLPELTTKHTNAKKAINNLVTFKTNFDKATNERVIAFDGLRSLSTKILNAFAVCGASNEAIDDVQTINRKIQGTRAGKLPEPDPANPTAPLPPTHSVSQLSYDSLTQNFSTLITTVAAEPLYTPNETELQVATLQAKLTQLTTTNTALSTATTAYSNGRISRDEELYHEETGLVTIALSVKKYIKSIFGAASPEYEQVSGLEFTRPKS